MTQAYACRIKPSSYGAISSENPHFNLEELHAWVKEHGDGYFIRDEDHKTFDCQYLSIDVFEAIYRFDRFKPELFHPITLKQRR